MAPPRRILKEQLEILMNFLEDNREMSKGLIPGAPVSHQETRQKWALLAKRLNSVDGGAMKTPVGWKKYWFEWRHKCKKKARRKLQNDSDGCSGRFVPFNDLEVRALELSGEGTSGAMTTSKVENSVSDDSDSEPLENIKMQSSNKDNRKNQPIFHSLQDDEIHQSASPPPRWALDLEERRIAAEERMALALESISNVMTSQNERRIILEERIADALTGIAETVHALNTGINDAIHHFQQFCPMRNGSEPKVFL